jgi:hypothetical protein
VLELQLLRLGIDPAGARTKSNFLALVRQKPETLEQWAALTKAWEAVTGSSPNSKIFNKL